jgi:hypothetical protein
MHRVLPDRPIIEIPDKRKWRDGVDRLPRNLRRQESPLAVVDFNSCTSDSREWADEPRYPERHSARGIRIGVNCIVYAMPR